MSNTQNGLIIVESPSKAKTLKKFLGDGYIVEASVGHIRELSKTNNGVDIERFNSALPHKPEYFKEHFGTPLTSFKVIMVSRNQAQIESLSATSNLLVWNEPTSNVTVIWVDDTSEGAGR